MNSQTQAKSSLVLNSILGILIGSSFTNFAHADNPPPEYTLKITGVPDYIFGSATYATPVSFKISGCDKARIVKISGKFKYQGKEKSYEFGGRWGPGDGSTSSSDPSSDFTAFAASLLYDSITCANYKTEDAQFVLTVKFIPIIDSIDQPETTAVSDTTTGKVKTMFVDERMKCVELPSSGSGLPHKIDLTETSQLIAGRKSGHTEFNKFMNHHTPVPETVVSPPLFGFHAPTDEATAECIESGATIRAKTRLYDDTDWNAGWGVGYGYSARAYALQRGGYFYVSYGGKSVEPLGSERAMNLGDTSGSFDATLFDGTYGASVVSVNAGGLNLAGALNGGTGIVWALAGGPWSKVFGTVSSLFAIYASVDQADGSYPDRADGQAVVFWSHCTVTSEAHDSFTLPRPIDNQEGQTIAHSSACNVGDQWVLSLNLASAVVAESKPPIGPHSEPTSVDSTSNIWYSAASVDDLQDLDVVTY